MTLEEFFDYVNENSIIILYDSNQNLIDAYDGHNSIHERYNEYLIVDIFPDAYMMQHAIGIEIAEPW